MKKRLSEQDSKVFVQWLPEEPGQARAHMGKSLDSMLILKQSNTVFVGMGASHWPDFRDRADMFRRIVMLMEA